MKIKKILRLSAEDSGGRNRTRTCDPIDVNDVLYQLSHATNLLFFARISLATGAIIA